MSRIENRISRGGSVRAVFSRRCKGHAAPLDLIIAHLKAAVLWRELWKAQRQNEAMAARLAVSGYENGVAMQKRAVSNLGVEARARIAADFAGYLVTDCDDAELRALELVPAVPFAANRIRHKPALDRVAMTGRGPWSLELQSSEFSAGCGALDAPEFIAAGAMRAYSGGDGFRVRVPVLSVRDRSVMSAGGGGFEAPFSERRAVYAPKNDRIAMTAYGPWMDELQRCFHAYDFHGSLDAPCVIAAGAMRRVGDSGFLPALAGRS